MKRNAIRIGLGVVVALAAVIGIAWIGGAFDDDGDGAVESVDDTVAGDTVPSDGTLDPISDTTLPPETTGAAAEPTECPEEDGSSEQVRQFDAAPPMCIDPAASYTATIATNVGDLTVDLDAEAAPETVNSFVTLARYHYFDDTICHRIIPGFMAQCGDPTGTGTGGPGYTLPDELPAEGEYQVGSVVMANTGQPNSGGSQFFIITGDSGVSLPPTYSLFGQVTEDSMATVEALDAAGNPDPAANGVPPLEEITIESVTVTES